MEVSAVAANLIDGCVLWFTGLSGTGKSTIAQALRDFLRKRNISAVVLDGDALRTGLNSDLGYSAADRTENLRRVAHVADLFQKQGFVTIVATISPEQQHRDSARQIIGKGFVEVFVDTPLQICEARDPKGLYKRVRHGEIPDFTGVDSPYNAPGNPDISLPTEVLSVDESVQSIFNFFERAAALDLLS
jgi:adenylylsulfate kinase